MPLATAPNLIELADFSAGWHPDLEASAVPPNGLLEVLNLLPDIGSGTLEVRKGYSAFGADVDDGFTIRTMTPYNRYVGTTQGQYIMLVATNGTPNTSNNVRVYALKLSDASVTRVDPGLTFTTATGRHWGETINGSYFGGGDGLPMYEWNPDDGWDSNPSDQNYDELKDVEVDTTIGAGEVGSDFAFDKRQEVMYFDSVTASTHAYSAAERNRFKPWKKGHEYAKGDKVSVKVTRAGAGGGPYMRSYKCEANHTSTLSNKPGSGTAFQEWHRIELSLPRDEDGEISPDWNLIPTAAETGMAMWHAERLWLRWDNLSVQGKHRVQYSSPSQPVKGSDTGELEWDPRDFRVGDSEEEGGGWLPDFTEEVTAMYSFGYYGLFFTRTQCKVLAGVNENTWVFRDLAPVGAIGQHAVVEHDGLVYFLSDRGLQVTDGTQVVEAEGAERIRDWLREAVNWETGGVGNEVHMWSFGGFVWAALPTGAGRKPDATLVYDPASKSVWLLDLPVACAVVNRISGVDQLFFTTPVKMGSVTEFNAVYAWTGTEGRSSSTRVLAAVTRTNLCTNPNFDPAHAATGQSDQGALTGAKTNWAATHQTFNGSFKASTLASKGPGTGAEVFNRADAPSHKGIANTVADVDTSTHTISCYVRRADWRKHPLVSYNTFRAYVDGELAQGAHSFEKVGSSGWYRMTATYTGSTTPRAHGFVVGPGLTFHIDKVMIYDGNDELPYFDGNGGAALEDHVTTGDAGGQVFQYDHPDVQDTPTDAGQPIPWGMRTAWLPFGVLREERRIRRVWALVRGTAEVIIRGYRNYSDEVVFEATDTPSGNSPAEHVEGLTMPDGYAASIAVQGYWAPGAILGVSLDTQPRRIRYHS